MGSNKSITNMKHVYWINNKTGNAKEAEYSVAEAAYRAGEYYISLQTTEEGIDYSIFDAKYHLLDGGVYDDPDISMDEALSEVLKELINLKWKNNVCVFLKPIDYP